jgi:ornithine--oxo-acid transaminase
VYPVSAVVGTEEALGVLKPGDHGSTFGGNAIAAAVSLKALELLSQPALIEQVAELGDWALGYLQKKLSGHSLVREIRGKGLFIGVELNTPARPVVVALKEKGVLTKETHEVVIRLAPPLVIKKRTLKTALDALIEVLGPGLP